MLKDMGYKDSMGTVGPSEQKEPKIRYPSFSLSKNIPPELMGKDMGATCRIELVVKVIGKSIDQYSEDRHERLELEIHKLGYLANSEGKTKDEYLGMDEDQRAEYDKKQLEDKDEEL